MVKEDQKFKVGDKIVRFGEVYEIFKIETRTDSKGKQEEVIYFRLCIKTEQNKSLVHSIPVKNINKTCTRRLISKKEGELLLKKLSEKSETKVPINIKEAKWKLNLSDPYNSVLVLKGLWLEKKDVLNFTESKREMFKLSMRLLVEELVFVSNISLSESKRRVEAALES